MPAPRAVEHARLDPGELLPSRRARRARRAARRDGPPAPRRRGRGDRAAGRRPAPGRCRRAARRDRPHRPGRRRRHPPSTATAVEARRRRSDGSAIQATLPCSSSVQLFIAPSPGRRVQLERTRALGGEIEHRRGRSGAQRSTYSPCGIEPLLLQQRGSGRGSRAPRRGPCRRPTATCPRSTTGPRRRAASDTTARRASSRRAGACTGSSRRPCECGSAGSPLSASWRIPASTSPNPVSPRHHASNSSSPPDVPCRVSRRSARRGC